MITKQNAYSFVNYCLNIMQTTMASYVYIKMFF